MIISRIFQLLRITTWYIRIYSDPSKASFRDPFAIPVLGRPKQRPNVRAFTFRPDFRRRSRCACLLFNYPGMRFLALSADPDVDPPRASLQRSSAFASAFPTVRKLTCLRGILRRSNISLLLFCRTTFLRTVNARVSKKYREIVKFLALPSLPPFLCISSEMKISTLLHALGRVFRAEEYFSYTRNARIHRLLYTQIRNEIVN